MSKESFGRVRNSVVAPQPYPSGHITSGYLASCLRHFVQILAMLGLQIPAERYTQSASRRMR